MKRLVMIALFMLGLSPALQAAVKGEEVQYKAGTTVLKGYLAHDTAIKGKRPGIIVVHEWWGHNEYARQRARMLAELGYTALALDMYGDGHQAHHPSDAGKFSSEVRKNLAVAKQRFDAAVAELKKHPSVDPNNIGAIGYCFGGAIVLEMARLGNDLKGVVSFHGNLTTEQPAKAGQVKARVLVLTGVDDPFVPAAQVEGFKKEMDAAKVDYRLIAYPGARHGFTSKEADDNSKKFNLPALAYNAEADQKSWAEMKAFFKQVFPKR
ncbi:MAG TPA: dienelactone hydrolase [Gammaproteobacteria bacterium]|nr:dienelactone hydrolase [Gammaproteobacteria bacterium]